MQTSSYQEFSSNNGKKILKVITKETFGIYLGSCVLQTTNNSKSQHIGLQLMVTTTPLGHHISWEQQESTEFDNSALERQI